MFIQTKIFWWKAIYQQVKRPSTVHLKKIYWLVMGGWIVVGFFIPSTYNISAVAPGWEERTDWPDDYPRPPQSERSLFFIQRNLNANTIVYDVDVEEGVIRQRHPINAYWLRYGEDGAKKDLTWLQAVLAYGYKSKIIEQGFQIKLKAYNDRYIQLIQRDGRWIPTMQIKGILANLNNIYVYADESGVFPDVKYVDVYGTNLKTGEIIKERIYNE